MFSGTLLRAPTLNHEIQDGVKSLAHKNAPISEQDKGLATELWYLDSTKHTANQNTESRRNELSIDVLHLLWELFDDFLA